MPNDTKEKKNETVFFNRLPGADEDDIANEKPIDLSFMEPTEEEKAKAAAAEERKAARDKELKDEEEAEKAKLKEKEDAEAKAKEEAEAAKNKANDKDEDLTDEEKAEAAKLEESRKKVENEADKDKKEDKGDKKKSPMVPKTRLDEVLAANKQLKAELEAERAARESRQPKPKDGEAAFDFDAKETEYMKLVMEGETAKALAIRKEIRAEEAKLHAKAADENSGQTSEAKALAKAAAVIEERFPQFVKGHADYNEEATKVVIKMRDGLIATGSNAVEALNEAVEFAVRKFGFDADLEEVKDDKKVVDLDKKREENTKKKLEAKEKQPPEVLGDGNKTKKEEKNDVAEMSDEEFNALPASALKRLRGDIF